jgi:hypothetical protein
MAIDRLFGTLSTKDDKFELMINNFQQSSAAFNAIFGLNIITSCHKTSPGLFVQNPVVNSQG